MASARQIKARLKSIKNTKKVTKAMELVAGAKMRRCVERALSSRQYTLLTWQLAQRLSKSRAVPEGDYLHRFFHATVNPQRYLLIAFASNRGLCGAYNSNVLRQVLKMVREKGQANVDVVVIGKRLVSAVSVFGIKPIMAYEKDESAMDASSVVTLANYAYESFKTGTVDAVYLAYSHFKSALSQEAVTRPLFPFSEEKSSLADVQDMQPRRAIEPLQEIERAQSYVYEPDKRKVLSYLVPRLGEAQLYQAMLESNASEHSARMMAMKSATDAAGDMLDELLLQFNRARQAGITREIAEISAGMAALT
ncbi:MAG: ATP synthase F1 subunit gamma [Parcubacteria group bacterium]|nr:ATP synthase F1 subunit gamma [Parcubacteria group bacterium]